METTTQVRELTPDYKIWMAGNAVGNKDVVWQYHCRQLKAAVVKLSNIAAK